MTADEKLKRLEKSVKKANYKLHKLLKKIGKGTTEEKIEFIKSQIAKGRLPIQEKHFLDHVDILQKVYGENWDVYFRLESNDGESLIHYWVNVEDSIYDSNDELIGYEASIKLDFNPGFLLRFPEIQIKNSRGYSHKIKELFVFLKTVIMEGEIFYVQTFLGTRLAASVREIHSRYTHSHLSRESYTGKRVKFQNFCTGVTPFAQLTQRIYMSARDRNFSEQIGITELFLRQLPMFLEWESVEGVPYVYIKDITGKGAVNELKTISARNFYISLMDYYKNLEPEERRKINFKFSKDKKSVIVDDDEDFEKFIKYKGPDFNEYNFSHLVLKDSKGEYFGFINANSEIPEEILSHEGERKLWFRGNTVKFYKYEDDGLQNVDNFEIHPKIKQYVKEQIDYNNKKRTVTRSALEQLGQVEDTREGVQQDSVLM